MYKGKSIAVIVPAHNEEKLIGRVLKTMPDFVDKIIVVDDASTDRTIEKVEEFRDKLKKRLVLLRHSSNQGVGGALTTGYKWSRDHKMAITAVMNGDAQMDPNDLSAIVMPVAKAEADYTKGNRLIYDRAWEMMPRYRYLGNAVLSLLTKIASGYWHIADSQTGYTAASLKVLETLDLDKLYKSYGVPNDILVKLNVYNFRVREVPVKPIYGIGEKSGIKLWKVIPKISFLLFKGFLWRLKVKYIIKDFHPLVFFYGLFFFLVVLDIPLGIRFVYRFITTGIIPRINFLTFLFILVMALQSLFFAMWFDMEYNKHLK